MIELQAKTPCERLLPLSVQGLALSEVELGGVASLSPYGDVSAFSEVLQSAHGMAWPQANRATGRAGARCVWFGQDQAILVGPTPDVGLSKLAAVVDQSDAWAGVKLEGAKASDVLARLVPVDLRDVAFKEGHTVRTQALHVSVSITRLSDGYLIMAFRSMAQTLVYELKEAMAAVAARS